MKTILLFILLLYSTITLGQKNTEKEFFIHANMGLATLHYESFTAIRPPLENRAIQHSYGLFDINIRSGYNFFFQSKKQPKLGLQLGAAVGSNIPMESYFLMPISAGFITVIPLSAITNHALEISVGIGLSANILAYSTAHSGPKFLLDIKYRYKRVSIGLHGNYTHAFSADTFPYNAYTFSIGLGYQFLTNRQFIYEDD